MKNATTSKWGCVPNRRSLYAGARFYSRARRSARQPRLLSTSAVASKPSATLCTLVRSVDSLASRSKPASRIRSTPVLDAAKRECVHGLLHQSPRPFGKHRSTWTLPLLAEVCCELGLSPQPLSAPTLRDAILRLGANWKRAKHWITSPAPAYVRKKSVAPD
jgi:hypothetical protein